MLDAPWPMNSQAQGLILYIIQVYLQVFLLSIRFCRAKVEIQDYFDKKKIPQFYFPITSNTCAS